MNKILYKEMVAFHPGYYVKEMIEAENMSQEELAKRLQTSGKNVSDLLNGKINLTNEMALRLAIVFDVPVSLWLNLNQTYIEKKLDIERRMQEDEDSELAKNIDYSFWVGLNLLEPVKKTREKVRELQRYLRISSLDVLRKRDFLVQYSKDVDIKDSDILSANAWVQTAINLAKQEDVPIFNKKKLEDILPTIRELSSYEQEKAEKELKRILGECGVVLVMLPSLKNCKINGAVKWINKEKVVVAINGEAKKKADFWFSVFHEIGHVMQQRLKVLIVSENKDLVEKNGLLQRLEEEADAFAKGQMAQTPKSHLDK